MLPVQLVFCLAIAALLSFAIVTSIKEKLLRASLISIAGLLVSTAFWLSLIYFRDTGLSQLLTTASVIAIGLFAIPSLIKYFPGSSELTPTDIQQYDERDNMFSRNNLKHHPDLAKKYYDANPDLENIDRAIAGKLELGEPGSRFYDNYLTPIASAAFAILSRSRDLCQGQVESKIADIDTERFAAVLRKTAILYGAVDLGITKLKPHHLYSNAGRHRENYGEPIVTDHTTAVTIIVPMDPAALRIAPAAGELIETSRAYVESAKVANIIAEYIRSFGYDARSHTDGNYQTLCVPIAADSGLGQVGRMGLLIHPVYGSCIRISTVTTTLGLPATSPKNYHIEDFCRICKKCANLCPTQSISKEWKTNTRNFDHFSIRQETCYSYWKRVGTDCGFCIRVCPYTKPNTLMHKIVRLYISRNPINQRIALAMENLLYGKKIKPKP